jgi:hypothetical protein
MTAWEMTDDKGIGLFWENGNKRMHVPLGEQDNVATFNLAPAYKNFTLFETTAGIEEDYESDPIIATPATVVSDDEEGDDNEDEEISGIPVRDKTDDEV